MLTQNGDTRTRRGHSRGPARPVLARDYFQRMQAPVRGFYTFEHSAHSPIFAEPEKAGRIMRDDVLNAVARPADGF